jgi:low affinity Fe/Cu permease
MMPLGGSESASQPSDEQGKFGWLHRHKIVPRVGHLSLGSRWVHRIDHYSSLPGAAIIVVTLLVGVIALGVALGFPTGWLIGFTVTTTGVTMVMVFVIQHTQGREQAVTQRKLDELLRALPSAKSELMMLEEAPESVLRDVEREQRISRTKDGDQGEVPDR